MRSSTCVQCFNPSHLTPFLPHTVYIHRDEEMRNINYLHPGMVDVCVISNLLNFPKHIFGFPFGCHGTNGNEALSLCLYSYRQLWQQRQRSSSKKGLAGTVLYINAPQTEDAAEAQHAIDASMQQIDLCCKRLNLQLQTASLHDAARNYSDAASVGVVLVDFKSKDFKETCAWASSKGLKVHIHLRDQQWRNIFMQHRSPVHFSLPAVVESISIEEGLLLNGYSVYRSMATRDLHLDVAYQWQAVYMSPNEGGSGPAAPLFADFCLVNLGWAALGEISESIDAAEDQDGSTEKDSHYLCHSPVAPDPGTGSSAAQRNAMPQPFDSVLDWALASLDEVPRSVLEAEMVTFQRSFLGGQSQQLEAFTTGGGSRSINLAFEAVFERAKQTCKKFTAGAQLKVLTGNPHLAVERAERRFEFDLERLDVDGAIDLALLRDAIGDPNVVAVYSQTLSYTDGITDPLTEIFEIVQEENGRRLRASATDELDEMMPITIINDSCLAFSVLVHNAETDASTGTKSMRILDIAEGCADTVPVIVTQDAHKHLGTDKGISTVIGTKGTLSFLDGHVKVGCQPRQRDLVRAIASMRLVGANGYVEKYRAVGEAVDAAVDSLENVLGKSVVHKSNRVRGSSVFAFEDPSGLMHKKLKKKGHLTALLFSLFRHQPERVQTGWQLSVTPYALRDIGGFPALDMFVNDAASCSKDLAASTKARLMWSLFADDSLLGCLLLDHVDAGLLKYLKDVGSAGHVLTRTFIRRFFMAQLDSGTASSARRPTPLKSLALRMIAGLAAFIATTQAFPGTLKGARSVAFTLAFIFLIHKA